MQNDDGYGMIKRMKLLPLCFAICCALGTGATHAQDIGRAGEMADMSLEQLSDIVVTSVTRQEARLSDAPASLYIISASDIRRSGARTLPEALRLAPNLEVARVDARNYAISARGLNGVFANKLLVLVDGRSIYTPLFSGVFWDAQDVVMADVARIEVISGPGATIWGANAVNGVINVITKDAADTQGGLLAASAGEHEGGSTVRYGGKLANGGHYRVYAKQGQADNSINPAGNRVPNGWHRSQAGFRTDWQQGGGELMVSGDAYQGKLAQLGTRDIAIGGANLIGRYTTKLAAGSDLRLEVIADHTQRDQPNAFIEHLNTLDLEAQHDLHLGRHSLAWGGGYRYSWDRLVNGPAFGFLPASKDLHWGNLFAQDEMALNPQLRLTAGIKFEHNNYTGTESLPNLRLAWTPDSNRLLWASLARTVRAPSRIDRDFFAPIKPPLVNGVPKYGLAGGPDFDSEVAKVAELGYRAQPTPTLSWSATAFFTDYDRLRTLEPHAGGPQRFENLGQGSAHGVEMWTRWQVLPAWRLDGSAVIQRVRTSLKPGSLDASGTTGLAANDPRQRYQLRSSHDLSEHSQLDLTLRWVGALPHPLVPAYHELDLNWIWMPRPNIDVSLSGVNLLHRNHTEFGSGPGRSVFERSALLNLAYRF